MSPAVMRVIAVPVALFAFALRLLETFWIQPLSWRIRPIGWAIPVQAGAVAVSAVVPVLVYLLVVQQRRSPPASLRVDVRHRRFVASVAPRSQGLLAIVATWIGTGLIMTERVPNTNRVRVADLSFAVPVSAALMS
jgi:hypothetical protein